MATLTKEEILNIDDRATLERVEIPEWGGEAYVRIMSGRERDALEESFRQGKKVSMLDARAKLVAKTLCDENGKRIFQDSDVPELTKKSAAVLDRLFDVAARLSGMAANDVEDLVKNSGTLPSEDSGSL